jgi:membrane fusion protein, multidrug efflux system
MKKLAIALLPLALMAGCKKEETPKPPPPSVTVSKPTTEQITPYLTETGNSVASSTVDLVARVSGFLESYNFVDGSMVDKNSLLFVIQPEPYANQVDEAQATLDADTAELTYDQAEYVRQLDMYEQQATSLADVQQWQATRDSAAAAVEGASASLENEKITYSYTHVFAPMNGRIGRHLVDPGNLVGDGAATELASLEQISPIYIYFSVSELDLLKLREIAKKADFQASEINQIPIGVALQNEKGFPHEGYLDFASTELEASTGTIQMRGILPNEDMAFLPGQFVQVRIAIGKPTPQLTLPDTAVMYDQVGAYVYTVKGGSKVVEKRVKTGSTNNNRIVIAQGLTAKDRVIVNGAQNATVGGVVKVQTAKKSK